MTSPKAAPVSDQPRRVSVVVRLGSPSGPSGGWSAPRCAATGELTVPVHAAGRAGNRHRGQDRAHDVVGGHAAQLGVGGERAGGARAPTGRRASRRRAARSRGRSWRRARERRAATRASRAGSHRARDRGGGGTRRRRRARSRAPRARRAPTAPSTRLRRRRPRLATGVSESTDAARLALGRRGSRPRPRVPGSPSGFA